MKSKWIFLSYILSDKLSGYGNGKRISINRTKQIKSGDTSNNSELSFPAHFGTHIDFPFHFSENGKTIENYNADYFVHSNIDIAEISVDENDLLITEKHFIDHKFKTNATFLIIKTGICNDRDKDNYWNNNPGPSPELATFLKNKMPSLKIIGLDTISLSSWKHREAGRVAHKEFLIENDLLIVEDMDLTTINSSAQILKLIIAPLRFEKADGTPVTILAEIGNEN